MKGSTLWTAPEVNPINRKARSIPVLNVFNVYGRVFFFSWFAFMVAFWAWYTFPPLLTHTIKANLHLTPAQVANSNIVSLCATLMIRYIAGPACDRFGPRLVFAGLLLIGSIPLGLAPLVHNAQGLYVSRFFIGILGGSFVPSMVWATGFFDKNIVGTANALAGGWGNAGGGITYFIMPAVFDAFVGRGYSAGTAWRLTFIVPLIVTLATGVLMILLCPDTPTGKWSDRHLHAEQNLVSHGVVESPLNTTNGVVDVPGSITDKASSEATHPHESDQEKKMEDNAGYDHEAALSKDEMMVIAQGEVVKKPTAGMVLKILVSPQTLFHIVTYMCSFGAELAINSILSAFYVKNFPKTLGQTDAANWAAMFGFLNVITRPAGGFLSDTLYKSTNHNLWSKKILVVTLGCLTGMMLIIIGTVDPKDLPTMIGLIALMAVFLEAGNGANFSLIPHVHPYANGIVSGTTGAGGNLGGIIFSIIFRFVDGSTNYAKTFWIIGIIMIGLNLCLCWVAPLPRGQIGGH
ncbi:Uu.00g039750.m01.CDS01 [Anthostomella pinea]|uniref:Nitrate/nitrite transporter n=1 Tax=Anthostomella pinea TaxID=933095 RepID=A0AAI8YDW1_9PEZI|nr:Uu.00g039750.m01.CDS01 [Anthostomella pinea]